MLLDLAVNFQQLFHHIEAASAATTADFFLIELSSKREKQKSIKFINKISYFPFSAICSNCERTIFFYCGMGLCAAMAVTAAAAQILF